MDGNVTEMQVRRQTTRPVFIGLVAVFRIAIQPVLKKLFQAAWEANCFPELKKTCLFGS